MIKPRLPECISIRNEADAPAEIRVKGVIGQRYDKETWSLTDTEETVLNELSKIAAGKKINVRINSKGGDVGFALGIYNALQRRAADVTTYNDGYALSSASIIMLAGGRVVSPTSSVWMIHRAASGTYGTAEDKRKDAEMLEAHDKTIAAIYAKRTGMSAEECLKMMSAETWMTGEEAIEKGFADEEEKDGDVEPDDDVDDEERAVIARFRKIPENLRGRLVLNAHGDKPNGGSPRQKPTENSMKKLIDALSAAGIKLPENATEEQIVAAFTTLQTENQNHRMAQRKRVENRVQAAVESKRIKAERKDWWIAQGLVDEACLDQLDEIAAPKAEAPAAPAAPKAPRGAQPAPPEPSSADNSNDTEAQINAVLDEINALRAGGRGPRYAEEIAPKVGALTLKLKTLRGDTQPKVEFVKA